MRSLAAWLGFLALVSGGGGSDRLLAAPLQPELDVLPAIECTTSPPAINWVCVNDVWVPPPGGEVTPPPPESTPRVISVGEEVTGTLQPCCSEGPAVFEILFELTAPSDGTLVVHLSSDAYLVLEDVYWSPMWRSPRVLSTVATLQVTAGQTYRLWVYYPSWDLYGPVTFVLTTSIEAGPVTLPPVCEFAPPGSNWVCVNGGWVPEDHPLALANPPISPTPPLPPLPTLPPPEPPVVGPVGCASVQPVSTWICVNGGWVPPDHPLAVGASTNPTPPSTPPAPPLPPVPPTGCLGPDPFVGIPGLVGVCVNGGWVPLSHPLARRAP